MSAPAIPLYLRRYQVDIALPGNTITVASDKFEPNALRCTFEVVQRAFQVFWTAEINLYNLSEDTISAIFSAVKFQAVEVTLQAGYKSSNQGYGVIWKGPIFQTLYNREGVVDGILTLHCILGLGDIGRNFISQTFVAGLTQADLAQRIAASAFSKIPVAKLSNQLKTTPSSRGDVVFGPPQKYFTQIAEDVPGGAQWWFSRDGLAISSLTDDDIPTIPKLIFTPPVLPTANVAGGNNPATPGDGVIVGTPQQTPYGVIFSALIDSRAAVSKPFIKIKIDNTQIRKQKVFPNPGQTPQVGILDKDGEYIVVGTRFVGDTRGNDWQVEIDGFTSTGAKVELMKLLQANSNGA